MSFQEQEKLLFDLLFDDQIRQYFCDDSKSLLDNYDLSEEEKQDFKVIRSDALVLDAKMRRDILLSHFCRAFPISFALLSSLNGGFSLLKSLIDIDTMRTPSLQRASFFGQRLCESLQKFNFEVATEAPMIIAIAEAEMGMALTATALKSEAMEKRSTGPVATTLADNCLTLPISLAEHVSASIIPRPYAELKRGFCAVTGSELWHYLRQTPVTRSQRKKIFQQETPRLLMMRAYIGHASHCEPTVEHQTVELSDGFAPLFQHVNGSIVLSRFCRN